MTIISVAFGYFLEVLLRWVLPFLALWLEGADFWDTSFVSSIHMFESLASLAPSVESKQQEKNPRNSPSAVPVSLAT